MTPNAEPEKDFPWWLVILAVTGLWLFYQILSDDFYYGALRILSKGLVVTLAVAVVAYLGACGMGLGLAVMGMSKHIVLRQTARLYIEVMRGVPIIVLLLYVAFVLVPGVVQGINWLAGEDIARTRDVPLLWRAVFALMLAYSAFLAEIFRAGLQAVDKGGAGPGPERLATVPPCSISTGFPADPAAFGQ
jgi:polar amino acid transport system permease protein